MWKLLLTPIIITILTALHCDFSFIDPIQLKIITTQDGFDGFYTLDGTDTAYFSGGILTNGISEYSEQFDYIQTLDIQVTTRASTTSVLIQVYRNQNKVKELFQDALSQSVTIGFTYQYGEELNTNTTNGGS